MQLAAGVSEDELDAAADEATVGLAVEDRSRIEQSVAVVNAVYGVEDQLAELAKDLVVQYRFPSHTKSCDYVYTKP